MNFKSDNYAGVCPEIMQALAAANGGYTAAYGADDYTKRLKEKVAKIFEHEVTIYLTSTGTAANCLALSAIAPAYGAIYCHDHAHINTDECGASAMFTNAVLKTVGGKDGKIDVRDLERQVSNDLELRPHASKPVAISVTQLTEGGTSYSLDELAAIKACAKRYGLGMHMDGARFANALVTLGCTPAQMTWKAGVDVLSFGATKNGAMMAEIVVFFDQKFAADQLASKTRFIAAQFLAYFDQDLWLKNARHANAMAQRLAATLRDVPGVSIDHAVQGNEIFVTMPQAMADQLTKEGAQFYSWGQGCYRLVTSWATLEKDVEAFEMAIAGGKR
jgi:threonine aldolase